MTALKDIEKIEAPGIWRADEAAQRRDVYVSLGDNTIIITDPTGTALAHWSLPAVHRVNPGHEPARYSPALGDNEELEVDDALLIEVIERVRSAIEAAQPHPGRVRSFAIAVLILTVAVSLTFWVPTALKAHALRALPPQQQDALGAALLSEITRYTGRVCSNQTAMRALDKVAARLFPNTSTELKVVPESTQPIIALPGQIFVISNTLLTAHDEPEILAGHLMSASLLAQKKPPLETYLDAASVTETIRLLTLSAPSARTLTAYAEQTLTAQSSVARSEDLIGAFELLRLDLTPFARSRGEAIPQATSPVVSLLSDTEWVALQAICSA